MNFKVKLAVVIRFSKQKITLTKLNAEISGALINVMLSIIGFGLNLYKLL